MSKHKPPKTEGYTWLEFSFIAFNGSGYANRNSANDFVDSYINYKKWKNQNDAVKLATEYYKILLTLAQDLIDNSYVTKKPSIKNWDKYQYFINDNRLTLI